MYDIRLAPLSYGTFVDVVQFSMSDRCSFPSVCCSRSVTALLLYHIAFRLSRGFPNFFEVFYFFLIRDCHAVAVLDSFVSIPLCFSFVKRFS